MGKKIIKSNHFMTFWAPFLILNLSINVKASVLDILEVIARNQNGSFLSISKGDLQSSTTHRAMSFNGNKSTITYDFPHAGKSFFKIDPKNTKNIETLKNGLCHYLGMRDGRVINFDIATLSKIEKGTTSLVLFHVDSRSQFSPVKTKGDHYIKRVTCSGGDYTDSYYLKRTYFYPRSSSKKKILVSKIRFPHHYVQGVAQYFSSNSNAKAICQLYGFENVYKKFQAITIFPSKKKQVNIYLTFIDKTEVTGLKHEVIHTPRYIKSIACQKSLN